MNTDNGFDDFLTNVEDAEEGVDYIKPSIELKLPAKKRNECRDIVLEIKKFGVSQRQMLYIIQLLSLELEDRETMQALMKVITENREKIQVSGLILE